MVPNKKQSKSFLNFEAMIFRFHTRISSSSNLFDLLSSVSFNISETPRESLFFACSPCFVCFAGSLRWCFFLAIIVNRQHMKSRLSMTGSLLAAGFQNHHKKQGHKEKTKNDG